MPISIGNTGAMPHTRGVPLPTRPIVHAEPQPRTAFVSPIRLAPEPGPVTEPPKPRGRRGSTPNRVSPHAGVRRYNYADIVSRYRSGQTIGEIRTATGCHPETTRKILKDAGVRLRPQRGGSTRKHDYDAIRRLYVEEQMTMSAVAQALGIRKESVRTALLNLEVPLRDDRKRNGGRSRTLDWDDIAARYKAGGTPEEIAAATGAAPDTVGNIVRALAKDGVLTLRPRRAPVQVESEEHKALFAAIVATVATGATYAQAARVHGVSPRTVRRAVDRYNETAHPYQHQEAS